MVGSVKLLASAAGDPAYPRRITPLFILRPLANQVGAASFSTLRCSR
jgi:hypothetical protein